MRKCATFCGQDTSQYTHIGTEKLQLPLQPGADIPKLVEELKRRCGSRAPIFLFTDEAQPG